jgi:hypothetical protein
MKARGAHSSGVERVPLVCARTRPVIWFAGQPATQRTANARTGWIAAVAFINLMIPNNGRVVGKQAHFRYYRSVGVKTDGGSDGR